MTSTDQPDSLAALASVAQLADDMDGAVARLIVRLVTRARDHGCTWSDIGRALGISRQAAYHRYGRSVPGEVEDVETQ